MTATPLADDARDHLTPARYRNQVVTLTIALDGGQEVVWRHLVDPSLLAGWSPVVPEHGLDVAGTNRCREREQDQWVDATVTEVRAPWFLEHRWGAEALTWQLAPSGEQTQLHLVHELSESSMAAQVAAGWHLCLTVLRRQLQGIDTPRCVGQDALDHGWEELREAYAADFAERFTEEQQQQEQRD
ncbi:hypothetical protein GCM10027030_13320 [Luteococcus sediminum]